MKIRTNRGSIERPASGCRLIACDQNNKGKCIKTPKPLTGKEDVCAYYYDKYMKQFS